MLLSLLVHAPRGNVLVIDDEITATEIFAQALQLNGYDVSAALDAEAGLRAALSTTFDAVLLDLVMPVLDGREWLRRFRAARSRPTMPVAIVTGHYLMDDQTLQELQQLGAMVRFKPLWLEDLLAITEALIEGNRAAGDRGTH